MATPRGDLIILDQSFDSLDFSSVRSALEGVFVAEGIVYSFRLLHSDCQKKAILWILRVRRLALGLVWRVIWRPDGAIVT